MTANKFRNLALELPGATEQAHMDHPDFRVGGKIFASLGYPDGSWGMVKLTPEQQVSFLTKAPDVFHPCKGVWGQRGATNVLIGSATVAIVRAALGAAWRDVVATKQASDESAQQKPARRPREGKC